ncbi:hypothetical protein WN943_006858 [Citrus x changshan-huyou]
MSVYVVAWSLLEDNVFILVEEGNWGSIVEGDQSRSRVIVMPRNEFNHPQLANNVADSVLLYGELPGILWRLNEVRTHMEIFYKKLIIICHAGKK